ncbi:MAG: hypothetical protein ACTSPY_15845 [Candidatus Helarchaeota archaeon]
MNVLEDSHPEIEYKRKILKNLIFIGLILSFEIFIIITLLMMTINYNNITYLLGNSMIFIPILAIFSILFIKGIIKLKHFEKIVERKVICPICGIIYIAHEKAIDEMNEVMRSKPELNINPKSILCCECFKKIVE